MALKIYDTAKDEIRDATQEDIDKLQTIALDYFRFRSIIKHLCEHGRDSDYIKRIWDDVK